MPGRGHDDGAGGAGDATAPSGEQPTTPGLDQALAEARPAEDIEDRRIRAAARARLFGDDQPVRIGRFTLLERLGAGAMGVVYAAWDPQLDRKIALKLVRPDGIVAGHGRERLLDEARAAARLSHPAVVTVFDAGTWEDQVWIAMEHIAGVTLRAWLAREPTWPRIIEVARQIAGGLAAAHAGGVLHRDFKPDNVLVADRADGLSAKVVDFGLAIGVEQGATPRGSGTPAYMAPEQHAGRPLTEASDQFAFGVTFLEALDGHHPFDHGDRPIREAAVTGEVREPDSRTGPAWIRAVLVRAVALDPADRFASMAELDRALSRDPRARWRRGLVAATLVLAGASAGVIGFGLRGDSTTDPCAAAARALAPTWPGRRAEMVAALVAVDRPWADATARHAAELLDQWAGVWQRGRVAACRATVVEHVQSPALLDLRTSCLDRLRIRGEAVIDGLAHADATAAARDIDQVVAPPDPALCDDIAELRRTVPLPTRAGAADSAARIERELAAAQTALGLGQPQRVGDLASVVEAAGELDWPPLIARAAYVDGVAAEVAGDFTRGTARFEDSLWTAVAARSDRVAAEAAAHLVWTHTQWTLDQDAAQRWIPVAEAMARATGDDAMIGRVIDHVGVHAAKLGDYPAAERHHRRALELLERALGAEHPSVINPRVNLAIALFRQHRLDEAETELARGAALARRVRGEHDPVLGPILTNLGRFASERGDYDRALAYDQEALAIKEATLGPDHPGLTSTLTAISAVLGDQGQIRESLPYLERVDRILSARDPLHPGLINPLINLVLAQIALDMPEMVATADRLVAIADRAYGADGADGFYPYVLAGWVRLETGDPAGALARLEPLEHHAGRAAAAEAERGDLELCLARTLHRLGREPQRVRALADAARAHLAEHVTGDVDRASIDRRLAELGVEPLTAP